MTNRPTYQSDEELIKKLQGVLRAAPPPTSPLEPSGRQVGDVRAIAEELAQRIHADPAKWGIVDVPPQFRDDAASDAFTALLYAVPDMRGKQSVTEWFTTTVQTKYRRLEAMAEKQAEERERDDSQPAGRRDEREAPSLFQQQGGLWSQFEAEYPRDAFALRLRYLLRREPDEMAAMLDAPSARAITMRLDRARERFRMYCEQHGMNRREAADLVAQVSEEPES